MTGERLPHEEWEELVAGYSLYALEPDEQQRVDEHLQDCRSCRQLLREQEQVAADLAGLGGEEAPPPQLWERIGASLTPKEPAATAAAAAALTAQVPDPRTRHWWQRPAVLTAAAALLVVVAGVGVWQGVDRSRGGTTSVQALVSGCRQDDTCRVVELDHGQQQQAVVLLRGEQVQLLATGLPALASDRTYVLWQLPRDGAPLGIAAFDISGARTPVVSSPLPLPLARTAAFAVSREEGHTVPAAPTDVVAVGAA